MILTSDGSIKMILTSDGSILSPFSILICSIFQDLLDRAERRDLPTAHQLLIWRDRQGNYFARKQ